MVACYVAVTDESRDGRSHMLKQLAGAADWRGVAAQERAARAVAAAVRTSMPGKAKPYV